MLHNRRRRGSSVPSGYYRFQGSGNQVLHGFGDGDFIRLRDEHGREWRGIAEVYETMVRFRFRDEDGNHVSGISDSGNGIVLRDEKGNTWRGFVD
ncbi:hypothetical protein [Bryobacter aggregatus]|uniref:hypothetical protein n=1 Tax=Bryobacter aggregatus TaxID=360054 RepID=UPI0005625540|nr:hypothetical protein [Bryobacter aggregatus]